MRPFYVDGKEGALRALELPDLGAVRVEMQLPANRGRIIDTRRVLPSGDELERTVSGTPTTPRRIPALSRKARPPRASPSPRRTTAAKRRATSGRLAAPQQLLPYLLLRRRWSSM